MLNIDKIQIVEESKMLSAAAVGFLIAFLIHTLTVYLLVL